MIVGPFTFFLVLGAAFMCFRKDYETRELLSAFRQARMPRARQGVREDNRRAEMLEKKRTAEKNMARTSSSGSGAGLFGNSSRKGITEGRGADIRLPTHTSDIDMPSTDRRSGNALAQFSTLDQAPTDEGPQQQQVPDPASRSSNGWWNRLLWSRRARPRINETRV
jgi:hypothetical protein